MATDHLLPPTGCPVHPSRCQEALVLLALVVDGVDLQGLQPEPGLLHVLEQREPLGVVEVGEGVALMGPRHWRLRIMSAARRIVSVGMKTASSPSRWLTSRP